MAQVRRPRQDLDAATVEQLDLANFPVNIYSCPATPTMRLTFQAFLQAGSAGLIDTGSHPPRYIYRSIKKKKGCTPSIHL